MPECFRAGSEKPKMSLGACKRFADRGVNPYKTFEINKKKENDQMKKSLTIAIVVLAIGSAVPVFAADGFFDRLGDRIDRRREAIELTTGSMHYPKRRARKAKPNSPITWIAKAIASKRVWIVVVIGSRI